MIHRNSHISISRQAELLGFSRGMAYDQAKPISASDLALMHVIDKLHMAHPDAAHGHSCHLPQACHAVDVLNEALANQPTPDIVNTDQGSQFTAQDFVDTVHAAGCQMRMDGRGAWRDHVMVERLWRSVKYEHVYLTAYAGVAQAKRENAHY